MADTPARRTRASTRTSATPAPSAAGSRKPRAKPPKALPAVPTGKSHAYGAAGKVELSTQLDDPSGGGGGFAARFRADRGAAVGRDVDDGAPDIQPARSPATAKTPFSRPVASKPVAAPVSVISTQKIATPYYLQPNANESTDNDEFDNDYPSDDFEPTGGFSFRREPSAADAGSFTDLETHFSYTTSMPPSTRSRRVAELQPPPTTEEREAAMPWSVSVFLETLHRRWRNVETYWAQVSPQIRQTCLGLLVALLLFFLVGPGRWLSLLQQGTGVCYRAGEYALKPFSYVQQRALGPGHNDLSKRMQTLELDMQGIRHQVRDIDPEGIKHLQSILPEQIMVRKNAQTGHLEFPPNFWHALQAKLDERDTEDAWDKFIKTNQKKMEQHAQGVVEKTVRNQRIINKEDLTAAVGENYAEFRERFSEQLRSFEASIRKSTELVARRTVSDVIKQLPENQGSTQLHSLALINMARNTELRLRTVNYFSHTYGASVHPDFTSPTYAQPRRGIWDWVNQNLHDFQGRGYPSPSRALTPWEEPSDCWCAAASDDMGKAQIGVLMPRAMRPTSITIEHMPSTGTLDIGAAPKEFEVWVRTRGGASASQSYNSHLGCGEAPQHGLVCIGKAAYDIHASNHIQNFDLEDLDGAVGFVNFAVVRITNNWGQDWTCIYRIRMHGDAEPTEESSVLDEL